MSGDPMLTLEEFAAMIVLQPDTVRKRAAKGLYRFARKVGKAWRFNRDGALKYCGEKLEGVR